MKTLIKNVNIIHPEEKINLQGTNILLSDGVIEKIGDIKFFIVPKSNIANIGLGEWGKMVTRFVEETKLFLRDYFQRNQSESGFAEDKRRTGWKIFQKRPDRIDAANAVIYAWHNLFWLGG